MFVDVFQPPDSCDASGEYTEDSDEDRASLSSEDMHNCSVATYREVAIGCSSYSQSGSNEAILDQDTPVNEKARPLPLPHSDSGSTKVSTIIHEVTVFRGHLGPYRYVIQILPNT